MFVFGLLEPHPHLDWLCFSHVSLFHLSGSIHWRECSLMNCSATVKAILRIGMWCVASKQGLLFYNLCFWTMIHGSVLVHATNSGWPNVKLHLRQWKPTKHHRCWICSLRLHNLWAQSIPAVSESKCYMQLWSLWLSSCIVTAAPLEQRSWGEKSVPRANFFPDQLGALSSTWNLWTCS